MSAAVLLAVLGERHALDVAAVGERYDARGVRHEVLHRDLVLVGDDLGAALRILLGAVARLDVRKVVPDDGVDLLGVGEDRLELRDRREEPRQLIRELVAFEPDELVEAHLEDGVHLEVRETESLHEPRLGLVARL